MKFLPRFAKDTEVLIENASDLSELCFGARVAVAQRDRPGRTVEQEDIFGAMTDDVDVSSA
jgi:hypothetical protein